MAAPMEIAFSFDTTSSMTAYIDTVRQKLSAITERLFSDLPNIRIGLLAHGDYHDKYVTRMIDLSSQDSMQDLLEFIKMAERTSGGDFPECYEYVMLESRRKFTWSKGTQKALVMVGDAIPHTKEEALAQNGLQLDWKEEAQGLVENGIRIHAVECGALNTNGFWKDLSKIGHGSHMKLDQFETIVDMILAVCYKEAGAEYFEAFEKEIHLREGPGIRTELTGMFDALRSDDKAMSETSGSSGYASKVLSDSESSVSNASKKRKCSFDSDDTTSVTSRKSHPAVSSSFTTPRAKRANRRSELRETIQVQRLRPSTKRATRQSKRRSSTSSANKQMLKTTRKLRSSTIKASQESVKRMLERGTTEKKTNEGSLAKKQVVKSPREGVTDDEFILSDFSWSKWKLAAAKDLKEVNNRGSKVWEQRTEEGVQRTRLFNDNSPAIFEYAVEPPMESREDPPTPVHYHVTDEDQYKLKRKSIWSDEINRPCMHTQCDKVLRKGCKLYVRRAPVSLPVKVQNHDGDVNTLKELRQLIHSTYDYAWVKRWVPLGDGYWAYKRRQLDMYGVRISQK